MPGTPDDIRAALEGLSPAQQKQFLDELERRRSAGPSNTPNSILGAAFLSGEQPTGQKRQEFEEGGVAGALSVPAITGAILAAPFAPRIAGATAGSAEGYKRGGVPGALVGGASGAVFPGATAIGAGASEGLDVAGVPGAVGGAALGGLLGGRGKDAFRVLRGVFGLGSRGARGAEIVKEVDAARRASQVAKALPPSAEKQAALEASRAARAAKAEEAVAAARGGGQAAAPNRFSGLSEEQMVQMARFLRRSSPTERAALQEWLKSQPPEVAKQIRDLLSRGTAQMPTTF